MPLDPDARNALTAMADGDGRYLLTLAETLFNIGPAEPMTTRDLSQALQKRSPGLRQGSRRALQHHLGPA